MRKNRLQSILTKEMLEYEYNLLGSMQKIADKLSVSIDSISKYMKLYKISYAPRYTGLYDCDETIFQNATEESFYLAGFIAADGSLQQRKYSKILKITLSKKDLDHLKKIKAAFDSNHPIKEYCVIPNKLVKKSHQSVEIQIVSEQIFNDLRKFNVVPNKTKIYSIPEWLSTHPLVHHYMRGYFDGDGTITHLSLGKGRTIRQGSFSMMGTYDFVKKYQAILVKNKIIDANKITNHGSIKRIMYCGNRRITNIYNFLYKDATIWLNRKKVKFETFIQNDVVPKLPNAACTTI